MKKEAKILLEKAINSLILSVEHFNRPWDRGRVEAVLILLDHAFQEGPGGVEKKDNTPDFDEIWEPYKNRKQEVRV
ncbi:MAG: hypothetical protein ACUVXF_12590 [Desulfobaccales bacterium]